MKIMRHLEIILVGMIVILKLSWVDCQENTTMNQQQDPDFPTELIVTTLENMPFSGVEFVNGTYTGRGYAFDILKLISDKLNFTYTVVPPEEHILGNEEKGILGQLYRKEVHMAAAFLPVLPELRNNCTFSIELDEVVITILMKRPQESASGSGLLAPFDQMVWLLVLCSVLVMGPLIYFFVLLRAKLWKDRESEEYSMQRCIWFVYGALLKQGATFSASSDSTRLLFATWWIFITILTSFYTANLTAFLTKPQFTLPITSIKDVVHKKYTWVAFSGRTVEFLLAQENETELTLLKKAPHHYYINDYYNPGHLILKTIDDDKIFIGEAHYFKTLLFEDYENKTRLQIDQSKRCKYVMISNGILVKNQAFAFPLNSTIIKAVNKQLLALTESGIVQKVKRESLPMAEVCPVDLRSTERQLRNTDLTLTYIVVGFGFGIAVLIFLLELILYMASRKNSSRHTQIVTPTIPINEGPRTRINLTDMTKKSPPSLYQNFNRSSVAMPLGRTHNINGRDYYVIVEQGGDQRLIPVRTPSAFLFQYIM